MVEIVSGGTVFVPSGPRDWQWDAEDGRLSARIREEDGGFRAILLAEGCWRKELPLAASGQQAADALAREIDAILRRLGTSAV